MKETTARKGAPETAARTDRGAPADGLVAVKMNTAIAGMRFSYGAGEIGRFTKAEARRIVDAGQGEYA